MHSFIQFTSARLLLCQVQLFLYYLSLVQTLASHHLALYSHSCFLGLFLLVLRCCGAVALRELAPPTFLFTFGAVSIAHADHLVGAP